MNKEQIIVATIIIIMFCIIVNDLTVYRIYHKLDLLDARITNIEMAK